MDLLPGEAIRTFKKSLTLLCLKQSNNLAVLYKTRYFNLFTCTKCGIKPTHIIRCNGSFLFKSNKASVCFLFISHLVYTGRSISPWQGVKLLILVITIRLAKYYKVDLSQKAQ